jgi:C-terminal processing protease CtpA/Prc
MTARVAAAAVRTNLGATQSLPEFLATAGELTLDERQLLLDQALVMIEQVYAHLPLKRAMYAIDPVQQLKLLRRRLGSLSERAFHDELISIYTHLRDLHTNYILPDPFKTRSAALPFRIEEFIEDGERKYVVTQISPLVADKNFKPGVVPTHWNGVPIDRAVEVNAEREAGSNPAARHGQGLATLTNRWMGMSLPPDEEWVVLRYLDGTVAREARFEWQVLLPGAPASGVDPLTATGEVGRRLGIDAKAAYQRRVLKLLFAPESIIAERRMAEVGAGAHAGAAEARGIDLGAVSVLPDAFKTFRTVETPHGTFGYIRLTTFNVADDEAFVQEFMRIASLLSQNGLILDVRGNGGGNIWAGERLLQVLTPRRIMPEQFALINSALTLRLCGAAPYLADWKDSIAQAIETGAAFSQSYPLTPIDACNSIGQKYQGPVVLVTDALCYSTTDMFAAGFQDHAIGKILGASPDTGAGGANVWTHDDLRASLPGADSPFQPLPNGATFRVALRRSTRVGDRSGVLLEDLGVVPDELHLMTRNDVLNGNIDLINHAARLLAAMPVYGLTATLAAGQTGGSPPAVTATAKNLDRIDVFVNGRPWLTLDVADGPNIVNLPAAAAHGQLEFQGFQNGRLVAATRLS